MVRPRLTAQQQNLIGSAAAQLPDGKREQFVERLAARLNLLGAFTDADLADAIRLSLIGLLLPRP